jgi:hypothetical protein
VAACGQQATNSWSRTGGVMRSPPPQTGVTYNFAK